MITLALNTVGFILSRTPAPLLKGFCRVAGSVTYGVFFNRRHMMLRNLHHAFPEKSEQNRRQIARKSCSRMIEMALLALAAPFFSKKRIRRFLSLHPTTEELHNPIKIDTDHPYIFLVPHFSLSEANTLLPACVEHKYYKDTAVFYRPLNQPVLEKWIKKTRERFGVTLLSRKSGLGQALTFLKDKKSVAILFDQNAGIPGTLTLFFNRLASSTELPDILNRKYPSNVYMFWLRRKGFWSGELMAHRIHHASEGVDSMPLIVKANLWLENYLKENDAQCADWLWFHNRWRTQDIVPYRFHFRTKRNSLEDSMNYQKLKELPKNTHVMIRLPNWLGDIVMALPLIQSLRKARPDFRITFLCQKGVISFVEQLGLAEEIIPLPKKGLNYYFKLWKLRQKYPDLHILFTNSLRGDLEARIIGAPQRFGITRPNRKRPLLSHAWHRKASIDEAHIHQTHLWEKFFKHFGLKEELDLTPIQTNLPVPQNFNPNVINIGLICGTENTPSKRWPIPHWRTLVSHLINYYSNKNPNKPINIYLYGTPNDKAITDQVAEGFDPAIVHNLAGKTSLLHFAQYLKHSDVIICNDTGGMHLANAIGVPVIALFGPTNPVRTGPIFTASQQIIQPPNCPPTGPGDIQEVTPLRVLDAALAQLEVPAKAAPTP